MKNQITAEQEARDMLERMGVEDAQSFSSGDLVELANLIAEVNELRKMKKLRNLSVIANVENKGI